MRRISFDAKLKSLPDLRVAPVGPDDEAGRQRRRRSVVDKDTAGRGPGVTSMFSAPLMNRTPPATAAS
jgi:hypothetical protein